MYLLDTNVVLDFFNSKLPINAKEFISDIEPKISFITRIELFAFHNISNVELTFLEKFVRFSIVFNKITPEIISITIYLRTKYKIKLPDAIIAATAIENNLTLISRNLKDFDKIVELKIINPYEI